jgi:ELWxxDGT repeat protein
VTASVYKYVPASNVASLAKAGLSFIFDEFTVNGVLYFFATDVSGSSKFMRLASVGAAVQTLATLSPQPTGPGSSCGEDGAAAIGTQLYFAANDGRSGLELWTSDGTPQGTHLTADIASGAADSYPCYLTALAGRVYFSTVGAIRVPIALPTPLRTPRGQCPLPPP